MNDESNQDGLNKIKGSDISYNETTKTITGLNNGDKVRVTIVISKGDDGNYTLTSQKVDFIKDDSEPIPIIGNLINGVSTNGGNPFELKDQSSSIYILPPTNKRKIKQVYNKTFSRKKHT